MRQIVRLTVFYAVMPNVRESSLWFFILFNFLEPRIFALVTSTLVFRNFRKPLNYNTQHNPSRDRDLNRNMKPIAAYRTVSVRRLEKFRK